MMKNESQSLIDSLVAAFGQSWNGGTFHDVTTHNSANKRHETILYKIGDNGIICK